MLHLPETRIRQVVNDLMYEDERVAEGHEQHIPWDLISALPGIRKIGEHTGELCMHYALRNAGWRSVIDIYDLEMGSVREPFKLLEHIGFDEMPGPQEGALCLYKFNDSPRAEHYGIFTCGLVRSKWGRGPIFEHIIDRVGLCYGNTMHFFTQSRKPREYIFRYVPNI
jgi:hypothetical protein